METIKDFLISRTLDIKDQEIHQHCIKYEYISFLYYKQYCNPEKCVFQYSKSISIDFLLTYTELRLNTIEDIEHILSKEFASSLIGFGGFRLQYVIHKNGNLFSTEYSEILVGYFKTSMDYKKNIFEN